MKILSRYLVPLLGMTVASLSNATELSIDSSFNNTFEVLFDFNDDLYDQSCVQAHKNMFLEEMESNNFLCTILPLGLDLAKGAAGKIPGVGGIAKGLVPFLFKKLFPGCQNGGSPNDFFGELYEEVRKITKEELEQNTMAIINGAIKNILTSMHEEYYPRKECADLTDAESRIDLFNNLQRINDAFRSGPGGMLGYLSANPAGLGTYVIGSGLQLLVFQEMALVDQIRGTPAKTPQDWCRSSYATTVSLRANQTSTFIVETFTNLRKERADNIKAAGGRYLWKPWLITDIGFNETKTSCFYMPTGSYSQRRDRECCYQWENLSCTQPDIARCRPQPSCPGDHRYWFDQGKAVYTGITMQNVTAKMNDPFEAAANQLELVTNPVPTVPCVRSGF